MISFSFRFFSLLLAFSSCIPLVTGQTRVYCYDSTGVAASFRRAGNCDDTIAECTTMFPYPTILPANWGGQERNRLCEPLGQSRNPVLRDKILGCRKSCRLCCDDKEIQNLIQAKEDHDKLRAEAEKFSEQHCKLIRYLCKSTLSRIREMTEQKCPGICPK